MAPAPRRTRRQDIANQQAGLPVSPLQELQATRRTRAPRQTRRTAAPVESLQSEITVSHTYDALPQLPEDVQPVSSALAEELEVRETSNPFIVSTPRHLATSIEHPRLSMSSTHMRVSPQSPIAPVLDSIAADHTSTQLPRLLVQLHAQDITDTPEFAHEPKVHGTGVALADIDDDDFSPPPTPHHIRVLWDFRQRQGLVHIWFNPDPKTMESSELPSYTSSVSMAMPLSSIQKFLKACLPLPDDKLMPHTATTAAATIIPTPTTTATESPTKQQSKRKLSAGETTDQPAAKRSKAIPTAPSTKPITKIHGRVDKKTGRINGRVYTLDGDYLVLDPYKPNMAVYNDADKDDYFMTYVPERHGFFYPSSYLLAKKSVAKKKAKAAAAKAAAEAADKKAKEAAAKEAAEIAAAQAKAATDAQAELEANIINAGADYETYSQISDDTDDTDDTDDESQDQNDEQDQGEDQSADQNGVNPGEHSKAENDLQAPLTPSASWTIGNLARSVSRFVPRLSTFVLSTTEQPVNTPASAQSTLANKSLQSQAASTPTLAAKSSQRRKTLEPIADLASFLRGTPLGERYGYTAEPRQPRVVGSPLPSASESRSRPVTEHTKDLQSARRSTGSTLKTKAQKVAEDREKKRKAVLLENKKMIEEEVARRVQDELAAKSEPESKRKRTSSDAAPTSPGRTYGFSYSDFSTDSSSDEEGPSTPTPSRPSKRPRVSPLAPASIEQTPGGYFVPDETDEEESPQLPPQRPTPAHAKLPATSWDPVASQRAQAMMFSPQKPSHLRTVNRMSSSVAASSPAPTPGEQSPGISIEAAVAATSDADLNPTEFPATNSYADTRVISSEVQALLDNAWGLEDEALATSMFDEEFASWKAQEPQLTTPFTFTFSA
ncbi:hypothetical protein MMC14_002280 [Varicellaria rhodocarpa]|nr:hypothetical protein [Varicellaria rhodocarpa]